MIQYFCDLSRAFTDEIGVMSDKIYGWRLVKIAEDQKGCEYYLTRWMVEDDALESHTYFAGMVVNVSFKRYDDGRILISTRDPWPVGTI